MRQQAGVAEERARLEQQAAQLEKEREADLAEARSMLLFFPAFLVHPVQLLIFLCCSLLGFLRGQMLLIGSGIAFQCSLIAR